MGKYSCITLLLAPVLFLVGTAAHLVIATPDPETNLTDSVEEPELVLPLDDSVPASSDLAPFVVYLKASRSNRYLCGGVLVSRQAVLTIASCILGKSMPQVVVGSLDNTQTTGPGIQVIEASEAVFHPSFLRNGHPNLAILKLNSYADVIPVDVPTRRFKIPEGVYLGMFGWGRLASFSSNAQTLQNTVVPYVSKNMCSLELRRKIPKHEICMGGEEAGSCNGSDGGSILWEGWLVGLIGQSHVCGEFGQLDVHINIIPYAKWIKRISRG